VRAGEASAVALASRDTAAALTFAGAELLPAAELPALLERWYAGRMAALPDFSALTADVYHLGEDGLPAAEEARLEALHRHFQSFRLLALTHGRPTGVEALGAWLHRRHGGVPGVLAAGEPILMLRNDYDRGLYNGDQGLVLRVREGGRPARLMALFPGARAGRWAAFDPDSLRDTVALAWAMTVHKAQGSEYDDVALVLPEAPIPLLTRELLYTALSRSRRAVVVCGGREVLAAGIARPLSRSSGVADKLRAALGRIGYSPASDPT
jgi:exodeoxyribonuclease V alpha subunit